MIDPVVVAFRLIGMVASDTQLSCRRCRKKQRRVEQLLDGCSSGGHGGNGVVRRRVIWFEMKAAHGRAVEPINSEQEAAIFGAILSFLHMFYGPISVARCIN